MIWLNYQFCLPFLIHNLLGKTLRGSKWTLIAGITILLFGIIFHLQGRSIVGPPTSFMYANPDWINHGMQIAIIGIGIIVLGIGMRFIKKTS